MPAKSIAVFFNICTANLLARISSGPTMTSELSKSSPSGCCPKCSAPLRPEIYFCPYCAEGWRNPEQGLEPTPEPVWDAETRIRLRAGGAYEACLLYLVALFIASLPHFILGEQQGGRTWDVILSAVCIGVASLWIGFRNFPLVKESLRLSGLISPWFLLSAVLLLPLLAVNHFYHALLLKETSVVVDPSIYVLADHHAWVAGLFVCLFPAVFEELGFRSYVYPLLQRALTPVWAAVISSALFASLHFSFWSWPYLFSLGLLFAFTATKCRSVWPCVVLHFAHNFAVLFLLPRS
jgi:membrane protease YdiL (CAAX protease family)